MRTAEVECAINTNCANKNWTSFVELLLIVAINTK